MKNITIICLLFLTSSCMKADWGIQPNTCQLDEPINANHSKGAAIQSILDAYTKKGLTGVSVAVYSENSFWAGASGYSKIETQTPMMPCHLMYSQSVAKTYMAVGILKMYEQGKLDLDGKITAYLPEDVLSKLPEPERITARMLLNHTSGMPEYNYHPDYISYLFQHPLHVFDPKEYLDYIDGKPLDFEPGSKSSYRNSNYLILALMGDHLTGDHTRYIREEILKPNGIVHTFYRDSPNYLDQPELVNSYWDRYSNGAIENCSQFQQANVKAMIGDDGIIATPIDYVKFLKALMERKILSESTMQQMLTFFKNDPDKVYGYGLGIHQDEQQGFIEYGHTGGGIGSGCYLGYFPDKNLYFFIGVNMGTIITSPIHKDVETMLDEFFAELVK